jgi:D-alanyl-D-alanine carboxypeptidase
MTNVVDQGTWIPGIRFWAAVLLAITGLVNMVPGAAQAKPRAAAIIVDADTGVVLYESNSRAKAYPASLTKMMTLYLLFEAIEAKQLKLDSYLTVSAHAAAQPATDLGLKTGQRISVETAILALVVHSANDVAVAVAEALGGTEAGFAALMTKKARELGMKSTVFRNASGLPDAKQVTTARDMAILARALIARFPGHYPYFAADSFSHRGRVYTSHNRVLRNYAGADGLKTGYTRASGYNLATSATRDGRRLVAVVLGGRSARARDLQMMDLLDRGFVLASKSSKLQVADASLPKTPSAKATAKGSTVADLPIPSTKPLLGVVQIASTESALGPSAEITTEALTPISAKNRWGVQVGAFNTYKPALDAAHRAAKRAAKLLAGAQIVVDEATKGKTKLYRARLIGLSKQNAKSACKQLKAKAIDCLVFQVDTNLAMNAAQ